MSRRVPLALLVILAALALPSGVAASAPTLTATLVPGREIDLSGSGFPASTPVTLEISRNGAPTGTRSLATDVSGRFSAVIDAGPGRGGRYAIVATAGTVTASTEIVAVETAGGGTARGTKPSLPPTTARSPSGLGDGPSGPAGAVGTILPWMLALGLAAALGLGWTRVRRGRL